MANGGIIGPVQTTTVNSVNDKISTFTSSGTFTAQATGNADYLVVAGAGAGGACQSPSNSGGAGAGAGGYRASGFGPSPLRGSAIAVNRTTEYTTASLLNAADGPGNSRGHLELVSGINENLDLIDDEFKWYKNRKLSNAINKKSRPIRKQLRRASEFIDALVPYINWDEDDNILCGDNQIDFSCYLNGFMAN